MQASSIGNVGYDRNHRVTYLVLASHTRTLAEMQIAIAAHLNDLDRGERPKVGHIVVINSEL